MPKSSLSPSRKVWLTLDGWAVLAATVFIALVVAGVLPRVPW